MLFVCSESEFSEWGETYNIISEELSSRNSSDERVAVSNTSEFYVTVT